MKDARQTALLTLYTCQRQGVWSDAALDRQIAADQLDQRDAALCTRLCFGVLQNRILLDFYLEQFSNVPLKRMEDKLLLILRLSAYQLLFLDQIPPHAAVSCAVKLTKNHCKNPKAAGLVNAILRSLLRKKEAHQMPRFPEERQQALSIQYSHPQWLVKAYTDLFGLETAEKILEANNAQPPIAIQTNTQKTDVFQLQERLEQKGILVQRHPWLDGCLLLSKTGNLHSLSLQKEGFFYVQDPASRLAVMAAGVQPNDSILDACAAPGGKSFACALEMKNLGHITSCDRSAKKIVRIQEGAQRLGLNCITAMPMDGRQFYEPWEKKFDCVLADVPCSGMGVIRKKPDIREKDPKEFERLPEVQSAILDNVSRYVRPNGVLLYSTCTLLEQENQQVVLAFLERHKEFSLQSFELPNPIGHIAEGMVTLLPHLYNTDGFFFAKLKRQG